MKQSACVGAQDLLQLLKNYARNLNIKTSIVVGVVGYPNVGKSSLINSLKRSRACKVASTAGSTRINQMIVLDKHLKLMDCPGIVFSNSNAVHNIENMLLNSKVDPIEAIQAILSKCDNSYLSELYQIPLFDSVNEFLVSVAKEKGKIRKGGVLDIEETAKAVFHDWNHGKIHYFVNPPAVPKDQMVVAELANEFVF